MAVISTSKFRTAWSRQFGKVQPLDIAVGTAFRLPDGESGHWLLDMDRDLLSSNLQAAIETAREWKLSPVVMMPPEDYDEAFRSYFRSMPSDERLLSTKWLGDYPKAAVVPTAPSSIHELPLPFYLAYSERLLFRVEEIKEAMYDVNKRLWGRTGSIWQMRGYEMAECGVETEAEPNRYCVACLKGTAFCDIHIVSHLAVDKRNH